MKTRSLVGQTAALTALALLVTACGGGLADSAQGRSDQPAASAAQAVYAQIAALPKDQQRAKAVELAKQEGAFSLYTSMTDSLAQPVVAAFTKQFAIPVSLFRANSETIVQRTLQEGQANRPGADAVESDFAEMATLAGEHLFADYDGPALDRVKEGRFDHWTADRVNLFLPAWNTNLIAPGQEPRSWEALADPKYRGKITIELSDSDWYANLTDYWLAHGKTQQQVDQLWQGIVANAKAAKGHVVMMQLLSAGQTSMDAMNYTYITQQSKDAGAPVAYRLADGTNPIPAFPRPNGVGMLANAQHPASAWLFYDWMLDEGQKLLVEQHLTPSTEVEGDTSLQGLNIVPFDTRSLVENAKSWDDRYDAQLRGVQQVSN
ncbi:ABC transporter substrate-binding protein [Pseudonocardia spinosispora]|uniref:ABC transporter substrate-binding protein n=1 Tax=Pseudonocardia spinosispora TaxID=103441 RepID=UPI0003FFE6BC|nr:ABC transporter substrate-binding protein [Pseudonocardia spinosispora]